MLESKAVSQCSRVIVETAAGKPAQRILAEIDLFASVDRNVLLGIEQACRYRRFAAQEQIVDRDSLASDVYLSSAAERVVNYSVSGREITFADLDEGITSADFGDRRGSRGRPASWPSRTVSCALPRRLFITILADYPQAALSVMQRLARWSAAPMSASWTCRLSPPTTASRRNFSGKRRATRRSATLR